MTIKRGSTRYFLAALRGRALQKQRRRCAYCRETLTCRQATADHVKPRAKGGLDHESNIVAACAECNTLKGSKSAGQFMKLIKKPDQYRGPVFDAWFRRRFNLVIERAERRILASVGRVSNV